MAMAHVIRKTAFANVPKVFRAKRAMPSYVHLRVVPTAPASLPYIFVVAAHVYVTQGLLVLGVVWSCATTSVVCTAIA